jgi:hypothetical protein
MLSLDTVDLEEKQPTEYWLSLRCDHWSGSVGSNGLATSNRRADPCTPADLENMREIVALFDRRVTLKAEGESYVVARSSSGETARFLSLHRNEL